MYAGPVSWVSNYINIGCETMADIDKVPRMERATSLPAIKSAMEYVDLSRPWKRAVPPSPRKRSQGVDLCRQPPTTPLYVPRANTKSTTRLPPTGKATQTLPPHYGGGPRATSILMMQWNPTAGWDQHMPPSSHREYVSWLMGTHDVPFTNSALSRIRDGVLPSVARVHWGDRGEFLMGRAQSKFGIPSSSAMTSSAFSMRSSMAEQEEKGDH
jgi:hypothetical protein